MSNFDPCAHLNIVINSDDSITRLKGIPSVDANPEASPGMPTVSKDVVVNPETKVWVRIFRPTKLPSNDNTVARLPIIFYFHGGGFILFSAANVQTHQVCCGLASEIPAIIISVDHRLAPEHRLPAQYDDAVDAMLWVKQQSLDPEGEQWVKDYGDFSRCYIGGRGSGGNIAIHAAVRASEIDLKPLKINGVFMNQPMFGGEERTKSELKKNLDQLTPLPVTDLMWKLALPKGSNRDHFFCNPMVESPYKIKMTSIGRCLVVGFSNDPMMDRLQDFVTMLVLSGVQVDAHFDESGFHYVDIVDPRRASVLLNLIREFII